ncbi:MAG TPA: glycoside hydrolase family 18 protein [Candidatus Acidoferrum sp.]|nr:glycoside hydrolase family 18 protein [Candidatus Acidoferrum sp.]
MPTVRWQSLISRLLWRFGPKILSPFRLAPLPHVRSILGFLLSSPLCFLPVPGRAALWTTGYYPGYHQASFPPPAIDFTALTHIIHFSVLPNSDGSLNTSANGLTPAYSAALLTAAHSTGRKVLICVGGAGSQTGFQGATTPANRATFVNNLTNFMAVYGYDGVDIDWEPMPATDFNQFTNLVNALRSALNAFPAQKLLTVAAQAYPVYGDPISSDYTMFASLQNQFDQINIMTYDLAGPYPGWVTWFNSPIFDGGYRFPSSGGLVPSIDGAVRNFLAYGVAAAKLGLGTPFYGKVWTQGSGTSTGGTLLPRQSWTNAPTTTAVAYSQIISSYFQSNLYHWDTSAQAAWLSITNSVSTNDQFISYDDEYSSQAKVSYARNHFLGGLMIWEITQDYRPTQPAGQRNPLLQALKSAQATPSFTSIQLTNRDILLSFTTLPLAAYRLLWTTNLETPNWNTLTNNIPGSGAPIQLADPGAAANQPSRFYRLQTPP